MLNISPAEVTARRIVQLCNARPKDVNYHYRGGLVVNGEKINFFDIITIDYHRDFVGNYSDIITVEAVIDTRALYEKVLPNIENLNGFLQRRQMLENSIIFSIGGLNELEEFRAFIHNPPRQGLGGSIVGSNEILDPDQTISTITVQFIHKESYDLKMSMFSGLMEATVPAEALAMILSGTGEPYGIKGLQMADWDVNKPVQVIIPRGMYVKDIPHYIQNEYGIYNHGIGTYIFNYNDERIWFTYPLFNNNRYEKEYFKLTIFVVPQNLDDRGIPRTYFVDDGNLTLYTTAGVTYMQNNTTDALNNGTGIQVINPIENRSINTEEVGVNKYKIDGSKGMSSYNVVDRKDGTKNIVPIYEDVTNQSRLISSVAGNQGTYITITWMAANPNLLQPGMPVKIQYVDGKIKTLYGTLHEYHAILVKGSRGAGELPYNCTLQMKIYVTETPEVAV